MAALAQETAELAARVAEECKSLRTLINANSPDLSALNTSATNNLVAAVNEVWTITQSGIEWDNIQSKPSTFTPSAHVHSWSDITSGVPTSFTPSAHKTSHATGGSDELTAADIGAAPTSHTHTASQISDSTATGQSLMTAANASSARTTLGLGNAALATTSTGGNGSSDSGKVLAFGSNGEIRAAFYVLSGTSGNSTLLGTNLTSAKIHQSPNADGTYALTASASGVPDNIAPPLDKTTPIDADEVVIRDSAASFVAKRLSFANLWTWITTKLGGNLTIGGTKTWSGQQEATGQAATNGTSLMTRDLAQREAAWQIGRVRNSDVAVFGTGGSGATANVNDGDQLLTGLNAGAKAFCRRYRLINKHNPVSGVGNQASDPFMIASFFAGFIPSGGSNLGVIRFIVGMSETGGGPDANANALTGAGIGWEIYWSSANSRAEIRLFAHNGTSYVASSGEAFPVTDNNSFGTCIIEHLANGTINLYATTGWSRPSSTPILTLSGAPSSGSFANGGYVYWQAANHPTIAPTQQILFKVLDRKLIML